MVKKVFLLILFFAFNSYAQSIEVFATTDTTDYLIGDYIKYRIEITHAENVRIDTILVRDSVKTLEFISRKPVQIGSKGDEVVEIYDYIFSKYDSTTVTIPELPVKYYVGDEKEVSTIYTNPVTINVKSLPVNPQKDIQDVKAPFKIPFDWWMILLFALIIIALIVIGYFLYKKYKLKKEGGVKTVKRIIVAPHKEALKKLYELED
ncbi:MAG: hypothetical protein D6830_00415, partial [Ignavibacteria bacterium]